MTVTITGSGDGPVLSVALTDQPATAGVPFSYTVPAGTFSDLDTPTLTLSATLADGSPLPGWLTFTPATGQFSGTPPVGFTFIDVRVTASDGSAMATDVFQISAGPIDTTPPAPPVIATVTDNVGTITGTVPAGGVTDDAVLVLSGTAEPNSTLNLYDGVTLIGTVTADGAGNWTFTTAALPQATHAFTATATDGAGNTSASSAAYAVTVDTTAPAAPTVAPLATSDPTPTITGTWDNASGNTFESVVVNGVTYTVGADLTISGGTWTLTIPAGNALADGTYNVVINTRDAAGNAAADATSSELTVDTTPPAAPTVATLSTTAPAPTLTGTFDAAGTNVLQVTVDGVTYTLGVDPALTASGSTWNLNLATAGQTLALGSYSVTVSAADALGNSILDASSSELTITAVPDTTPPAAPVIATATDNVGMFTGAVGTGGVTDDSVLVLTGTAEPNSTVTIYNGATLVGTVVADASGNWSLSTPTLPEAQHDFTAMATDGAGNTSAASPTYTVTVDTTATATPTVDTLTTPDVAPAISGWFDSSDTDRMWVTVNGVTYTMGVDAALTTSGNTWTLNLAAAGQSLAPGAYGVLVTASDVAGNLIGDATAGELVIQAAGTTTPTVTVPVLPADTTPPVSGNTPPASLLPPLSSTTPPDGVGAPPFTQPVDVSTPPSSIGGGAGSGSGLGIAGLPDLNALPAPAAGLPSAPLPGGSQAEANVPPPAAPADQLYVYQGVQNASTRVDGRYDFQVPADTFAHTNPSAQVRLEATLVDGSPLPPWMSFNPGTGTFSGTPPTPAAAEIDVMLTARDEAGREASVVFRPIMTTAPLVDSSPFASAPLRPELNGFPVTRIPATELPASIAGSVAGTSGHSLFVFHGINSQRLDAGGNGMVRVPGDAFGHTDPAAIVFLEARLADGRPLPDWLQFNPVQGTFSGTPPAAFAGELEVEIVARDNEGREARTTFHLELDQVRTRAAEAAPAAPDPTLGLDVDAAEKEKARQAAERAQQAEKAAGKDGKPAPRGAQGFSEQLRGAKVTRDPLLDRISSAGEQAPRRSN